MEHSVATIQCQNLTCLTPNPLSNKFCEKCGTPLVRRYLRMMGDWVKTYYRLGELIEERYLVKSPQVVLDLKPVLAPQAPDDFPSYILPYLKLCSYRWHVPQVYGYIPTPDERLEMTIWLLEYGTVPTDASGELLAPDFLPQLSQLWPDATPIRQLYWLWQIANLWKPFQEKRVASSLLTPSLLRVNGAIVQLLELDIEKDEAEQPQFKELGQFWADWIPQASPQIKDFLEVLCQNLDEEKVSRTEQLTAILDQALQNCAGSQKRSYYLYTCTDTGTLRDHNEDACYPASGSFLSCDEQQATLAIVCDGIGGQEGGEIASRLAIETLQTDITHILTNQSNWNVHQLTPMLDESICKANDVISQRNDQENRQERRRMGTTLVMGLAYQQQIYIGHIGDSRVYRITSQGCHQVTVDDDLASREVRLGYLLYRDAIQYPNAGALVQALGMNSAASLHPTVQRYILDEDCVFLFCSDGLSDYDRVEQYWESDIVPVLTGEKTVTEVGQRLIEIANQKNGHDNSTIALFYCQVQPNPDFIPVLSYAEIEATAWQIPEELATLETFDNYKDAEDASAAELPTEPSFSVAPKVTSPTPRSVPSSTAPPRKSSSLPLVFGVLSLLGVSFAGGYAWWTRTPVTPNPTPSTISPVPLSMITAGKVLKNTTGITLQGQAGTTSINLDLPPNSIVKVVKIPTEQNIVTLEICSSPNGVPAVPGTIEMAKLENVLIPATSEELAKCSVPNTSTPSSQTN